MAVIELVDRNIEAKKIDKPKKEKSKNLKNEPAPKQVSSKIIKDNVSKL